MNTHIPKEYVIAPGEQVDYEVDYEEEARQLMRITRDELLRKYDFVNVIIGDGNSKEKKLEGKFTAKILGTLNFYSYQLEGLNTVLT